MTRMVGETVIRHRFAAFTTDSLGETKQATFGADDSVDGVAVDPSGSSEPQSQDSDVEIVATIYRLGAAPATSPHDEWTVRGERYAQAGELADWRSPFTGDRVGWVVKLTRSTG